MVAYRYERVALQFVDTAVGGDMRCSVKLESYFGIADVDDDGPPQPSPVFNAWTQLLKQGLISVEELQEALKENAVKELFSSRVKKHRKACFPLCHVALPYCQAIDDATLISLTCAQIPDPLSEEVDYTFQHFRFPNAAAWKSSIEAEPLKLKDEGNAAYLKKDFDEALECYEGAIQCFGVAVPVQCKELASVLYSNMAQVFLMKEDWNGARKHAGYAIAINEGNEKAKLRKVAAEENLLKKLGKIERDAKVRELSQMGESGQGCMPQ